MTRSLLSMTAGALVLLLFAAPASAQRRAPVRRPTLSPYLNLLNRNNGVGFNYYQRVRPEVEFRNADRQLSSDVNTLQSRLNDLKAQREELKQGLSTTGHVPRFMDLKGYFPGLGRR
jgi:hypothetical protein